MMFRILEIAWMAIAITTILVSIYLIATSQVSEAIFMLICATISGVMYFVRRKQRIRYDAYKQKEENEARYH